MHRRCLARSRRRNLWALRTIIPRAFKRLHIDSHTLWLCRELVVEVQVALIVTHYFKTVASPVAKPSLAASDSGLTAHLLEIAQRIGTPKAQPAVGAAYSRTHVPSSCRVNERLVRMAR